MATRDLIIHIKFGGLGDHLFYSHIPRIAKETGRYDKVFISNLSPIRSKEYKELIWEPNPFLDGFTDKKPSDLVNDAKMNQDTNILDVLMLRYGIDDGKRFHEPEIYYKPTQSKKFLFGKTLYDPNYTSLVGQFDSLDLEREIARRNYIVDYQMAFRNKSIVLRNVKNFVEAKNLKDFCEIMSSCKHIFCMTTGAATLAAALGKPAHVFYGIGQSPWFHHSSMHKYIFVKERLLKEIYHRILLPLERMGRKMNI